MTLVAKCEVVKLCEKNSCIKPVEINGRLLTEHKTGKMSVIVEMFLSIKTKTYELRNT
jgi:hypothetical protein